MQLIVKHNIIHMFHTSYWKIDQVENLKNKNLLQQYEFNVNK